MLAQNMLRTCEGKLADSSFAIPLSVTVSGSIWLLPSQIQVYLPWRLLPNNGRIPI